MSEKTEGTFKIKSKKKLTDQELGAKNKEPLVEVPSNITKVVIPEPSTIFIKLYKNNILYINFLIIPALFLLTSYIQKKSNNTYRKKLYLLKVIGMLVKLIFLFV